MIKPRQHNSPPDEVQEETTFLQNAGWENLQTTWDSDLKVWRATGTWKNQKRKARGSTEVLALSQFRTLTPQ